MTITISSAGTTDLADLDVAVVTKDGAYTITETDHRINCDASGGAFTVTLPVLADLSGNKIFHIKKVDSSANAVTISQGG